MHEVVVGVLILEGRVLLVHRRPEKHANPDVWDLPGGLVEAGESELDALARELHEELGVKIATAAATTRDRAYGVGGGVTESARRSWFGPVCLGGVAEMSHLLDMAAVGVGDVEVTAGRCGPGEHDLCPVG
jgi:8-oxo-dGTP pyrophosphatase MutT (NUDIX family)